MRKKAVNVGASRLRPARELPRLAAASHANWPAHLPVDLGKTCNFHEILDCMRTTDAIGHSDQRGRRLEAGPTARLRACLVPKAEKPNQTPKNVRSQSHSHRQSAREKNSPRGSLLFSRQLAVEKFRHYRRRPINIGHQKQVAVIDRHELRVRNQLLQDVTIGERHDWIVRAHHDQRWLAE